MAQSSRTQPSKIYRGTIDEVMKHRNEISLLATVELKVFDPLNDDEYDSRTLADMLHEIGTVAGLPSDLSTNPKYMLGFGTSHKLREP